MVDIDAIVAAARDVAMANISDRLDLKNGLKRQRSMKGEEEDQLSKQARANEDDEDILDFDGLQVRKPVVCVFDAGGNAVPLVWPPPGSVDGDHGPLVLPDHYVVAGDIRLFGLVDAKISVFQGRPTAGHPYSEIVTPTVAGLSASAFLPSLKDSPIDSVALENLRFTYSEVSFDVRQSAGLYLETDVVFKDDLQPVADILRDFFQQDQDKPALHVRAYLGSQRNWTRPVSTAEVVLRGSLEGVHVGVLDVLTFTRIGVEVGFFQRADENEKGQSAWQRTYGFFGDLHLQVPGTVVPRQAQYKLTVAGTDHYTLSVFLKDDEEWKDVFGVKGLSVRDVQMTAILASLDTKAQLQLRVEAALAWNDTHILLGGSYSKSAYALEAYIGNLTLQELGALFTRVTGHVLEALDHDVVFDAISLCISSTRGLVLSGAVTVHGHSTADATIAIAADGVHISGGIGDVVLEHITIKRANLDLFIGSANNTDFAHLAARSTHLRITGDVLFAGIALTAGLHLNKNERTGEVNKRAGEALKWTVYATATGDITTKALCPALEGSFLDISLRSLALIASNEETPSGDFNGAHYPVTQGVQFCAMIDDIPQLRSLLRGGDDIRGMVLRAVYEPLGKTFNLGIVLPGERTMSFGDAVDTGPLKELAIWTGGDEGDGGDIALVLEAALSMELATQPTTKPLAFAMNLTATSVGAKVVANMVSDWVNPCGVGQNVIVRGCALQFGIDYTTFFLTGMPGEFGMAGQLQIGSKSVSMAANFSENPKDMVLAGSVSDLGVVDLVQFASLVADKPFPAPADDFLHFELAQFYLSAADTRIGTVDYPAGASLAGEMVLFGKKAEFTCSVASMIKIKATVERFSLGPLTVRGADVAVAAAAADPIVDIEISPTKQSVLIDGAVDVWDVSAALHLAVEMLPSPKLDCWVDLRLSDLFVLPLQVKLTGDGDVKVDFKDLLNTLDQADFAVHALMEQHLVEYIMTQLEQQIKSARDASKHGLDDAVATLEAEEKEFQAGCQAAQDELERTRVVWHKKRDAVHGVFDRAKANADATKAELQASVDCAEAAYKRVVADATRRLEETRAQAAAAIRVAELAVDAAQLDSDDAIREKQGLLQNARTYFDANFGSVLSDLQQAQRAAEQAGSQVDKYDAALSRKAREIEDAPYYPLSIKSNLGLEYTSLLAAKASAVMDQGTAKGRLQLAELAVHGASLLVAEGAIGSAQAALDLTRQTKSAALAGCRTDLANVSRQQDQLVKEAVDALDAAQTPGLCNELRILDETRSALTVGSKAVDDVLNGAQRDVDALADCVELAAFDAAQQALTSAMENTTELDLARHAVDAVKDAVELGLDFADWAAQHGGSIVNLHKVEFSGSLSSLVANGPPLIVNIEGTVFEDKIDIHINWQPHFDLVAFVKALFDEVWALFTDSLSLTSSGR